MAGGHFPAVRESLPAAPRCPGHTCLLTCSPGSQRFPGLAGGFPGMWHQRDRPWDMITPETHHCSHVHLTALNSFGHQAQRQLWGCSENDMARALPPQASAGCEVTTRTGRGADGESANSGPLQGAVKTRTGRAGAQSGFPLSEDLSGRAPLGLPRGRPVRSSDGKPSVCPRDSASGRRRQVCLKYD